MLVDTSYSMVDCLDVAKSACYKLVRNLINVAIHRMPIISFESYIDKHCSLTNDLDVIESAVDYIHIGGSTNMAAGFNEAGNILQGQKEV